MTYARPRAIASFLLVAIAACARPESDWNDGAASHDDDIRAGERDTFNKTVGILRLQSKSFCTGTLVAPDLVLTAGHCTVSTKKIVSFYMGAGKRTTDYESTEALDGMAKYDAVAQAAYPLFTSSSESGPCPFTPMDVGLVKLAQPVTDVTPDPIDYREPAIGETCTAVGFGIHGDVLDWYHEKRWASERMRESRETAFAFDAISGGTESGDSGGPLYCQGKIVAVNSCKSNPDWFARLDAAKPWVATMLERWDPEAAASIVFGAPAPAPAHDADGGAP
jgi:V8-like Glu-specific endopeptidase